MGCCGSKVQECPSELDLSNKKIKELPKDVIKMTKLKRLKLNQNSLQNLQELCKS